MPGLQSLQGMLIYGRSASSKCRSASNAQFVLFCRQVGHVLMWDQFQEQLDDDSYEAVLLEELSEMRARFQKQVCKQLPLQTVFIMHLVISTITNMTFVLVVTL